MPVDYLTVTAPVNSVQLIMMAFFTATADEINPEHMTLLPEINKL